MITSYGKIWNLGHPQAAKVFEGQVQIEEKVDGSQFNFGLFDGQVHYRSRGATVYPTAPGMFVNAVATIENLAGRLKPGWVYRGEYLQKPKHNALAYDRVPRGFVILFDVMTGPETSLSYDEKAQAAEDLGLEVVPTYIEQDLTRARFDTLLGTTSVLGGQKIEGLVFKNYQQFGHDGKVLMAKYVSPAFREIHGGEWRKSNPTKGEFVDTLVSQYRTPARWNKAIQHLAERGKLESSPTDIGNLIKETQSDLVAEELEQMKAQLWAHFGPKILRGCVAGLPEWYKEELVKKQFGEVA